MTAGLTQQQAACLAFIKRYSEEHDGASPSLDEIRSALGLQSKTGAHRALSMLRERGFITWSANKARSIRVLPSLRDLAGWVAGLTDEELDGVMHAVAAAQRQRSATTPGGRRA